VRASFPALAATNPRARPKDEADANERIKRCDSGGEANPKRARFAPYCRALPLLYWKTSSTVTSKTRAIRSAKSNDGAYLFDSSAMIV
jgi:hypothetical protein